MLTTVSGTVDGQLRQVSLYHFSEIAPKITICLKTGRNYRECLITCSRDVPKVG